MTEPVTTTPQQVAALEAQVRGHGEDIGALRRGLEDLGRDVRRGIDDLANKLAQQQRTPWSVLIGFGGLILVIVGMMGSGYVREQGRIEAEVSAQADAFAGFIRYDADWLADWSYYRGAADQVARTLTERIDGNDRAMLARMESIEARVDRVHGTVIETTKAIAAQQEALGEVETQFDSFGRIDFERHNALRAMLDLQPLVFTGTGARSDR